MEAQVRRLIDKDEIVDLVHKYSFLIDHRRDELLDLFTDDCTIDYGPGVGPVIRGREALARFRAERTADDSGGFEATSHHNANVLVTFDDADRATVMTSLYAWHKATDGPNPRVWGYYHDVVVRTPEGWRFADRKLRIVGQEDFDDVAWHPLRDD